MAPSVLSEFTLSVDIDNFTRIFWLKNKWYENFLANKLQDLNIEIGDWEALPGQIDSKTRTICSHHPSKVSFPGLPSHAESWKEQVLTVVREGNTTTVTIEETNSFKGIPYADYFNVCTKWVVTSSDFTASSSTSSVQSASRAVDKDDSGNGETTSNEAKGSSSSISLENERSSSISMNGTSSRNHDMSNGDVGDGGGSGGIDANQASPISTVTIYLDFQFHKSTWLQGTIESNTRAELVGIFELWLETAQETLRRSMDIHSSSSASELNLLHPQLKDQEAALDGQQQKTPISNAIATNESIEVDMKSTGTASSMHSSIDGDDGDGNDIQAVATRVAPRGSEQEQQIGLLMPRVRSYEEYPSSYPSDEELEFYDCEEGGGTGTGSGGIERAAGLYRGHRETERAGSRRLSLLAGHSSADGSDIDVEGGRAGRYGGGHPPSSSLLSTSPTSPTSSAHETAVNIVETVFVLAQFTYWQVHNFYAYDLKEIFNIEPAGVVARIRNSFLPGWHTLVLVKPDLYGPLLAVFMLPQSLLISMEISRHGCNPTSQLGNALVVSLFIWVGLSSVYRLLALITAPTIELKHCLSVTGYSFFSWNLALLSLFPLENYKETLRIPTMFPLVIFGIPSSLAQGCMFWEHTPTSSMTLQPSALPTSLQQFATHNARCLQRLLWLLPKFVAFVIVAGTHYQFLWYMARVFLPGRRQICQLSALVQPSQYADILTQKELRQFAISLFGKRD
mmetsp:Transcript_8914/g.14815  ORF Transcript_8914/g.14815 Transcript_8914/m.14815 type:complete len:736 (+) Transcript_8914:105-2312(+)